MDRNEDRASGPFFQLGKTEGNKMHFDTIILAAGFGLERISTTYPTASYWRNEQFGQPILDGRQTRYVVSGYGDGALIDLCRLTIERFRQDTIVYELFGANPEKFEAKLSAALNRFGSGENLYDFLLGIDQDSLSSVREELSKRLRKDTTVALHISGKVGNIKSFSSIFGATSSFLNRLLTFLLYRCGAFSISFSDLDTCVSRHGAASNHVLCRHGADTLAHLRSIIIDHTRVGLRLEEMRDQRKQTPQRHWRPGTFPTLDLRSQR